MKFILPMLFPLLYTCTVLLSLASVSLAQPVSVKASSGSNHLVTAEITHVTFEFKGLSKNPRPVPIELEEGDMFYSHASADRKSGENIYYLHYQFQAIRAGSYEIPKVTFTTGRKNITSNRFTIHVYPKDALSKKSAKVEGRDLAYFTLTKASKSKLFPNETTHVEHKVYLPEQLRVALWGLPLGKKKNCSAWRFTTPNYHTSISRARINGKTYQAGSFRSNLTSLKEGQASLGPLKSRVVFHTLVMTRFGIQSKQSEIQALSDELTFTVKPLPSGQPKHFRGDVGNYILSAMINAPQNITESDSIQIIAQLSGTGNLATVNPPLLVDNEGWKIISENRTDLGNDRKSATGIAEFTYLIQPDTQDKFANQTPSLLFVSLDPESGEYRTSKIPGKSITINSSNLSTTKDHSEQDKTKPYSGLIISTDLKAYTPPWYRKLPIWLIHVIPLGLILLIIWKQLRKRIAARRVKNEERHLKKEELADLEKVDSLFLKSAGAYIERWIDTDKHPSAKEILSLRDSLCFRPDGRQDVSKERRKKIIQVLRKCSLVLLFTFFIQDSYASPQETFERAKAHFEQKNYTEAIADFQSILGTPEHPDILYNIGLSYQLNNSPGQAAYYYHLALKHTVDHAPALKNLNYVETNNGSITSPKLTDLERWIQTFTPRTYLHFIYFLISMMLCLILTFIYLKPKGSVFRLTIILCIFAPLILALCIYGYMYHPDKATHEYRPAVVLEEATLTSLPLESSQAVIEVPPASQCYLMAQPGSYTYVMMANGVKGWIDSKKVKTY